jgi:hypothetical protein
VRAYKICASKSKDTGLFSGPHAISFIFGNTSHNVQCYTKSQCLMRRPQWIQIDMHRKQTPKGANNNPQASTRKAKRRPEVTENTQKKQISEAQDPPRCLPHPTGRCGKRCGGPKETPRRAKRNPKESKRRPPKAIQDTQKGSQKEPRSTKK